MQELQALGEARQEAGRKDREWTTDKNEVSEWDKLLSPTVTLHQSSLICDSNSPWFLLILFTHSRTQCFMLDGVMR